MPTITPEIQKQLYLEADARFAAKTGIARKLDPKSALDQKYIPIWMHLYDDVKRQYQARTLVWTHDHPSVGPLVTQAGIASANAASHLDTARNSHILDQRSAATQSARREMEEAAALLQEAKHASDALIASGDPTAAAVAAGFDQALARKIADASQNVAALVANGQPIANDTADVVTAMQGQTAADHHATPPGAPAPAPIVPISATPLRASVEATMTPPPFNMKAALGISAGLVFLGAVAVIASKIDTSQKKRGRHHASRGHTTIVRYGHARARRARR